MKTKIAVLGAGRWGTHLVRNFASHPDAQLVAVVDSSRERLTQLKERLNLNDNVVLADNWQSIRSQIECDAVVIATPAVTHYSLIQDALQQGFHVLAEKPLTLDAAECQQLSDLARQQQRQLMVDHTYLFHPAVEQGKAVVQSGCLGELRYGYAARTNLGPVRQDVDALWDLAIHDIAIFNTWLGEQPVQVQATGRVWLQRQEGSVGAGLTNNVSQETANVTKPALLEKHDLADFVYVILTYPTGFQAYIHLCWLNPDKQRRLGVVGSQGTLIFDEMENDAPLTLQHGYFEQSGDVFTPGGLRREVIEIERREPLAQVCDRFLQSIRDNQPVSVSSGWVAAQLVNILSCLSQSLQQGGTPIKVPQLAE
ncbi:Homoserine dehydrogenase, NAD binding domain family [Coleofasciculus chthonoplastes PCC 7420]|uniref:Homoserine dehydrogenase, NAD binding domain family n=1 Tax=Coleofasciculus chthonoplastes PCC 7420 TaxID=118168 RepID=B4VNG1_9CYAN|nr:Gfo/Idh/MocA family oxidoreductase [Coleofasciculus chthonoplastes]EDX76289.1 Homoserine dehydrogenase, NAD binding domain family [Coleofasciculus chthonoplastes PCC 7420]